MIEIVEEEWFRMSSGGTPKWLDDFGAQYEYYPMREQLYAQMLGWA
jgi:hypothetical protein